MPFIPPTSSAVIVQRLAKLANASNATWDIVWTPDRSLKNWVSSSFDGSISGPGNGAIVGGTGRGKIQTTTASGGGIAGKNISLYGMRIDTGGTAYNPDWNYRMAAISLVGQNSSGRLWVRGDPDAAGSTWSIQCSCGPNSVAVSVVADAAQWTATVSGDNVGTKLGPSAIGHIVGVPGALIRAFGRGGKRYATSARGTGVLRVDFDPVHFGTRVDSSEGVSGFFGDLYGTILLGFSDPADAWMQMMLREAQQMLDDAVEPEPGSVFYSLSAGAITGTASITLGAVTASATGAVAVQGAASVTLGALAASATGTVAVQGAASVTLGALTSVAAGAVAVAGVASATLGALTSSASGAVSVQGAASVTLGALTQVADGAIGAAQITGQSATTLGALTQSSAGAVAIAGAASQTLSALTQSAAGAVAVTGAAATTLGALNQSAEGSVGSVPISGESTTTLGALTQVAAGRVDILGQLGVTLGGVIQVASGAVPVAGSHSVTLGALTQVASDAGTVIGSASVTLGQLTMTAKAMQSGLGVDFPRTRRIGDELVRFAAPRVGARRVQFKAGRIGDRVFRS